MIEFYNCLLENDIFSNTIIIFNTGKRILSDQYEELSFDRKTLDSSFTYLAALQNSSYMQSLSDIFHNTSGIITSISSIYNLTKTIVTICPEYESQFTEILSFLELADKSNMLEYHCETIETDDYHELVPNEIKLFTISIKQ